MPEPAIQKLGIFSVFEKLFTETEKNHFCVSRTTLYTQQK